MLQELDIPTDARLLTASDICEDAAVVRFPPGKALVQSLDFFTPIVNDAYAFGRIAAVNALSDIYAMGAQPVSAMNIVCFPVRDMQKSVLTAVLRGGLEAVVEAGAVLAGGHSVQDEELKYGLSVSGAVDPHRMASNSGLRAGDHLVLTKPLGTGVLATAVKAKWPDHEAMESTLLQWAGRLNAVPGRVIQELGLSAATDVTGFGLGGHLLEMARASGVHVEIFSQQVPFLQSALELAGMGLLPEGSYANAHYCASMVDIDPHVATLHADLIFDAQTSGGMVLAVPEAQLSRAIALLHNGGDMAEVIGRVRDIGPNQAVLRIS